MYSEWTDLLLLALVAFSGFSLYELRAILLELRKKK